MEKTLNDMARALASAQAGRKRAVDERQRWAHQIDQHMSVLTNIAAELKRRAGTEALELRVNKDGGLLDGQSGIWLSIGEPGPIGRDHEQTAIAVRPATLRLELQITGTVAVVYSPPSIDSQKVDADLWDSLVPSQIDRDSLLKLVQKFVLEAVKKDWPAPALRKSPDSNRVMSAPSRRRGL